jgi:hypothetical protein
LTRLNFYNLDVYRMLMLGTQGLDMGPCMHAMTPRKATCTTYGQDYGKVALLT